MGKQTPWRLERDGRESGRGSGGFGSAARQTHGDSIVKDQLDRLITEMLDRGLLFEEATKEFEKQFIMKCLERSGGNRTRTAKSLGIHRNTLQKKLSPSNHSNPRKKAGPTKKRLTR
ncbi:MAG: hypothetical protein F4Z21_07545 [Acidobacteria bacterium]|nr:hypothetical protein [Acidobacteriota bacterium]